MKRQCADRLPALYVLLILAASALPFGLSVPVSAGATGCGAPTVTLYTPSVSGLTVSVNGVTTPGSGCAIGSISWNWGDATPQMTGWFPQAHTYATGGTYTITVTSHQSDGQTASHSVTIVVTSPLSLLLVYASVLALAAAIIAIIAWLVHRGHWSGSKGAITESKKRGPHRGDKERKHDILEALSERGRTQTDLINVTHMGKGKLKGVLKDLVGSGEVSVRSVPPGMRGETQHDVYYITDAGRKLLEELDKFLGNPTSQEG